MIFFSLWGKSVSFFLVEHFGVSLVFLQDLFGEGDGDPSPFGPCLGPGHLDFSLFPINLGVEGPQPGVPEYYAVFS